MKILVCILCSILLFLSCHDKNVYDEPDTDVDLLKPYTDMDIVVPEGYASIVKLYDDTLAICTYTTKISVPTHLFLGMSRANSYPDAITIENVKNENNFYQGRLNTWQVVAFEDSRLADYDYNDLVIHVQWEISQTSYSVKVQPIALGSTKKIKLGFEKMDGNITDIHEVIIAEDCRAELFDGKEGFINTMFDRREIINNGRMKYNKSLAKQSHDLSCAVNWFIEVDNGVRLYAITNNKKCLSQEGRPYGLILDYIYDKARFCSKFENPSKSDACGLDWFLYPKEGTNISDVYDFERYIKTGDLSIFRIPREGYFDAVGEVEGTVREDGLIYCPKSLYHVVK